MTLAFIIAAAVAFILFFIIMDVRENIIVSGKTIKELKSKLDENKKEAEPINYGKQTKLSRELVIEGIKKNGFTPINDDGDWIQFKNHGVSYNISTSSLPGIQFYLGFSYDNKDLELLKRAADEAMKEDWLGRITFNAEIQTIEFRVFGIERSIEHFTETFMDYLNILNNLAEAHRYFYNKLLEENKTIDVQPIQNEEPIKDNKMLS